MSKEGRRYVRSTRNFKKHKKGRHPTQSFQTLIPRPLESQLKENPGPEASPGNLRSHEPGEALKSQRCDSDSDSYSDSDSDSDSDGDSDRDSDSDSELNSDSDSNSD